MSKKSLRLSIILTLVILLAGGCTFPWQKKASPAPTPGQIDPAAVSTATPLTLTNTSKLKKFDNYEQLAEFLAANNNPDIDVTRDLAFVSQVKTALPTANVALESAAAGDAGASQSAVNSLGYSGTNNQVAGVDEADIIKTDGAYIYALVRNELSIIKAAPAGEASVVSKITFKSRPQDIFIHGRYLAVFGSDNQIYSQPVYDTFRRQNPYTFFKVFDLSDPFNPKQVRDLDFEGSYYEARLIGDHVYFLTNTYGNYVANEPLLPRILDNGQVLATKCDGAQKCFMPEIYYFDIPYDSYTFTNIAAINIKDNSQPLSGQVYLLGAGQTLYVSQKNIYITYTQYLSEYELEQEVKRELLYPKLAAGDQDKIAQIEAAPVFVLNNHEKKSKVSAIINRYLDSLAAAERTAQQAEIDSLLKQKLVQKAKELEKTVIHKIAVNGDKLEYRAMGEVNGHILNQFSLDESGDYFRVATTRAQQSSRFSDFSTESHSNIYVLNASLKIVGSLENLATTERIYAARFLGDRVYLVTFKQTDPLFVISLSDPTKPAVLGALKLPGFSNYLHPIKADGSQIIGLGRDTEETANGGVRVKGLKLTLFDFSDVTKPKELDSYLIGDSTSDSIALADHKAFLYSAEKDLLSIPAVLRENGRLNFGGALIFSLADNRLRLQGRIDHSDGGNFTRADYWGGFDYYDNTVKRSLYIGDNLFTFSNKFLKINSLSDLSEVKSLELTSGGDDYIITKPVVVPPVASTTPPTSGAATPPDAPSLLPPSVTPENQGPTDASAPAASSTQP
ncbi:MAG: beta-propeller domain-containing protein [Patescibacteria group bacterium]